MRTHTGLALVCLLLAACGGPDHPLSAAVRATRDAGGGAGEPGDASVTIEDASVTIEDASVPGADASGTASDASVPNADSGTAPGPTTAADAGNSPDAGTAAAPADSGTPAPPPAGPSLAGCPMFPADNIWNRDVSGDALDPRSADILAFMGAGALRLHPDFGAPEYGQPFVIVGGEVPRAPMTFTYAGQSEPGPYPYPADLPIQSGSDHHGVVLNRDSCQLYETYMTARSGSGFSADSGAIFDLRTGALRPDGWTSATASGLPILPGLARYDEAVEQGEIRHALAFTAGASAHFFVHPATHASGTSGSSSAPPLGLRVRLRADYDLSGMHGTSLVIAHALQRYGMFLLDNANDSFWALAGAQDPRWPTQDLEQLKAVPASAFEVLQLGQLIPGQ
jgi:hypothetical protein